jgi:hypothetical protein
MMASLPHRRSARYAILLGVASLLSACGSETSASAPSNAAGQKSGNAGTATPTPSRAAVPASGTLAPAALAAWEAHARNTCRLMQERFVAKRFERFTGGGQEFTSTGNGYLTADFNGDGKTDYIMFTPNGGCAEDEGSRSYGSRGGPPTDFVISTPTGYKLFEGFGGWVVADMVKRRGDRDVLVFSDGRNGDCGFIREAVWGWSGNGVEVIERRNDRGALVDQEGCPVNAQVQAGLGPRFRPCHKEPMYGARLARRPHARLIGLL